MRGLLDYPTFDFRLLKRCSQKTASTVFGRLHSFLMTGFIVIRLKGAGHRDWMQSWQSFWSAIETGDTSLPGLVDVGSNIIGMWPLIVSYLKETGKKDSGDGLVVWLFLFALILVWLSLLFSVFMFRKKGWMDSSTSTSWAEWSFACSILS